MKLRLNLILRKALLACMASCVCFSTSSTAWGGESYMAEGVNAQNLTASERFYDNGKGYYWSWLNYTPFMGARSLYESTGSFAFLGDLASRIDTGSGFSTSSFSALTNDANTCWYNVASNVLQYWQSYYGVFANNIVYGYTYNKDYADDLGGTQSLKVGMYFYDNWTNDGGNLFMAANWYLAGDDSYYNYPYASSLKYKGKGGFFAEYFGEESATVYSYAENIHPSSFADELASHMGMEKQKDGSYQLIRKGQLVDLSIEHGGYGHALTCYGFTVSDSGMIESVQVTNSDDQSFELITLYVKYTDGAYHLYEDKACTKRWKYSGMTWQVSSISSINTPDILLQMYDSYTDADNALVWNGQKRYNKIWSAPSSTSIEELPDSTSSWVVKVMDEYFPAYAETGRKVRFDDYATKGTVKVQGTVETEEMHLANSSLQYSFTGATSSTSILADTIVANGTGDASFSNVSLTGSSAQVIHYTLSLESGSSMSYKTALFESGATFKLNDASAQFDSLTLGSYCSMELAASSTLSADTLYSGEGVVFRYANPGALLTFSGSMIADAPIVIDYAGTAVAGTRYTLIVFEDGLSNWSTLFSTAYGTLSYANNTLYLTYTPVTQKTHGSDFSAIDSSLSNAALLFDGKSPGNVSVNGQVPLSSISVTSGSYVWQDGTTSGSLHVADCISLSGSAIVESRLATLVGNQIELSGSSQLILNSGGTSVISRLTASLKTTVNVASGCVIFDDVTSLGALQVAEGAEAQFRNTEDLRISGDVTARGSLVLLNGGERDLVTYTFGNGILPFSNVTIGSSSFTTDVSVSLAAEGSPHGSYTIMGDGELRLLRDGVFSSAATGTGWITVAPGAVMELDVKDSKPTFASTLNLNIQGNARCGDAYTSLAGKVCSTALVSGELLLYGDHNALSLDTLALDGGSFKVANKTFVQNAQRNIGQVTVSANGGKLVDKFAEEGGYYTFSTYTTIGALSGTGNLTIQGESYIGTHLYRVASLEETGYSGQITLLHNSISWTQGYTYDQATVLELESMQMEGSVYLKTLTPCYNPEANSCFITALGIDGEVTLGGLDSTDNPVTRVYLYSGGLKASITLTHGEAFSSFINKEEHTLTLKADDNHRFSGTVYDSLNLVKKGSGEQAFLGDMSLFNGDVDVQEGTLSIKESFKARTLRVSNACLESEGTVNTGSNFAMENGSISAGALTSTVASISGVNCIEADRVSGQVWTLHLNKNHLNQAVLTVDGALTLSEIQLQYDAEQMYTENYALLRSTQAITLGTALENTHWETEEIDGVTYYTLWYSLTDGALLLPRSTPTSLTWNQASGIWAVEQGHNAGSWSATVANRNFYDGDTVIFNKAANVTLEGTVKPDAIQVSHASGELVFSGTGKISGDTSLQKTGSGTLKINTTNDYTGGSVINGGTVVVGTAKALGNGAVTLSNATLSIAHEDFANTLTTQGNSIIAVQNGVEWNLSSVIVNSGKLSLSGTLDVTNLGSLSSTGISYSEGGSNGFEISPTYSIRLVENRDTFSSTAVIKHGDYQLTLGNDGVARMGGATDYSAYYITSGHVATASAITSQSGGQLELVEMNGGKLIADSDIHVDARLGSIELTGGCLSGSISGSTLSISGGTMAAILKGNNKIYGSNTLSNVLTNTGTLQIQGRLDVSGVGPLQMMGTTYTEGGTNGFRINPLYSIKLVENSGTINSTATIIHGSLSLTLGNDGVATSGGDTDFSTYYITNGHSASVNSIVSQAGGKLNLIDMSGGVLQANADARIVATGGSITLTSGTLSGRISGATLSITGGSLTATLTGTNTLSGHNVLHNVLTNTGTLNISGTLDVTNLGNLETSPATFTEGGSNGFKGYEFCSIKLINNSGTLNNTATITHGGVVLTLGNDGVAKAAGTTDYTTYYMTTGHQASASVISAKSGGELRLIDMTGGVLRADADASVAATGGEIALSAGTLSGSISGAALSVSGGTLVATLTGTNTLSGNNKLSNVLDNDGTLYVSGTLDVSALGALSSSGITYTETGANGFKVGNVDSIKVVDNSGTINSSASIKHGTTILSLGSDGVARTERVVDYSTYYLGAGHAASVEHILNQAGKHLDSIEMTGGELHADGDERVELHATGGLIQLSSGELSGDISDAAIRLSGGKLTATLSGHNELSGENILSNVLTNNGMLSISGLLDVSAVGELTTLTGTSYTEGGCNGFKSSGAFSIKLIDNKGVIDSTATIIHGDIELTLGEDGVAYSDDVLNLSTYYINDKHCASVSDIISKSGGHLQLIDMKGGVLQANANATVEASGGEIRMMGTATVQGSISHTLVSMQENAARAIVRADISGTSRVEVSAGQLTLNGDNTYTGGTLLSGGVLQTGSTNALGKGNVALQGGTLKNTANSAAHLTEGVVTLGGATLAGAFTIAGSAGWVVEADTLIDGSLTLGGRGMLTLRDDAELQVDGTLQLDTFTLNLEGDYTLGETYTLICADRIRGGVAGITVNGLQDDYTLDISGNELTIQIGKDEIYWLNDKKANWKVGAMGWRNKSGALVKFENGSNVSIGDGNVTIVGTVSPGQVTLRPEKSLTLKRDKWNPGKIIGKDTKLVVSAGDKAKVTMNDGNTYGGGTIINSGTVNATGSSSFGTGEVVLKGGTLNLAGKEIRNDITLQGAAAVKSGKNYTGSFTMNGGELMKGSLLNIVSAATLSGGTVSGTLSGIGSVMVDGDVSLGTTAKLTTNKLEITKNGTLTAGTKGLAMNAKASAITVDGGVLNSAGKVAAYSLKMDEAATVSTGPLSMKDNIQLKDVSTLNVTGKLDAFSIKLTDSKLNANGNVSLKGNLELRNSHAKISDASPKNKAVSLSVKGDVDLTATESNDCSLTLSGALSATNLTLSGATLNLTGAKLQTVKVKNSLTLTGANTINLAFNVTEKDVDKGKTFKLFTFKSINMSTSDLHTLLGLDASYCSLALDKKKTSILLTVTDYDAWMDYITPDTSGHLLTTCAVEEGTEPVAEESATTLPMVTAPAVDAALAKVSDTLVQTTWGAAKASRAFVGSIEFRAQNAAALAGGRGAAWGAALGSSSRLSSHGGGQGADYNMSGAAVGAEISATELHNIGVAMGCTWGKVSTFSAYAADQDTTHVALYGSSRLKQTANGGLTLDWSAAYGRSENEADLMGGNYDWTQHSAQLDARLSYARALNERTVVRAFGGLQYLHVDAATPTAGAKADSMENLRVEVGVGATWMATTKTALNGEVSFIGDILRDNPAAVVGGTSRSGANPGRAGVNVGVGATHQLNESWSVNAGYNLELVPRATSHNASVGATYRF